MRIIVTGGAGFIGSHITDLLIQEGHKVTVVDNLSTGNRANLNPAADFHEKSIQDDSLKELFETFKPEAVFHLAAQVNVRTSVSDPVFDASENILGSIKLLELSRLSGVKKFIFASTGGAIYGEQEYFPADEKHPVNPVSPYGIAKLAVEKYLHYYKVQYGLKYVCLRYANVYGPRQNSKGEAGVVAIFSENAIKQKHSIINGDGKQTRDFVYVEDVARYNLASLRDDIEGIYNVGTGVETDVNQIYEFIAGAASSNISAQHGEAKPGEQIRSVITFEKASETMGFAPSVSIQEGIKQTVLWFQKSLINRS